MEIRGRAAVSHRWSESAPDVGVLQQPSPSGFSGPPGRQWLSFISRLHRTTKWPFYDHFLSALFAVQGNKKKKIPVWQRPLQRSLTRRLNFITPNNFFMTRPGNCGQHVIPVQGSEKKKDTETFRGSEGMWVFLYVRQIHLTRCFQCPGVLQEKSHFQRKSSDEGGHLRVVCIKAPGRCVKCYYRFEDIR